MAKLPTHVKWRDSDIPVVRASPQWMVSMSRLKRINPTKYAEVHGKLYFDPEGKAYELTSDSNKSKPTVYLYVHQQNEYIALTKVKVDDVIRDTFNRMSARRLKYGRGYVGQ